MQIRQLDHVNIQTTRLEEMVKWYADVLGMPAGDRPDFPFPGAWLYAGDTAAVHLIGRAEPAATGSEADLKLEHFAFTADGREEFVARLKAHGIEAKSTFIGSINTEQFHLHDPDGNHIHIDFVGESRP